MPFRTMVSRPPLERMLRIHTALQRGSLVNCTRLVRELEVSRKTVVRDIAFMRDRLNLPIEFDAHIQAYRYTEPVDTFPTVHVTEGDLLALLVARRALEQYQGTPFHEQLATAFDKLTHGLRDRIAFSPGGESTTVSFKNFGLGKTDLAVFNALSGAVLQQLAVVFDYRKPGDTKKTTRRVHPYHLTNRDNLWYLVAFDLNREALRTFALPRISQIRPTTEKFARPSDFSPEKFFANALGVLGGVGNYNVVIRFDASVADRVREREWHATQQMRELRDGALELRLKLGVLPEVERWILSWGAAAEVVAPPELRQSVRQTLAALTTRYAAE